MKKDRDHTASMVATECSCVFGEEARFGISRMRQPAEGTQFNMVGNSQLRISDHSPHVDRGSTLQFTELTATNAGEVPAGPKARLYWAIQTGSRPGVI